GEPCFRYAPLPALDFNAAGLLYFPAFSMIAEMAAPAGGALREREITYLGNLDPGGMVSAEACAQGLSLRDGTGALLAAVTTRTG
ncbi:hypothetical protein ICN82_09910, partial [Mangrovicoccus sp. HB182678]|nr:hypothetical protein [Mangrovicoccus algicola]